MASEVSVKLDFTLNELGDLIVSDATYDLGSASAFAFNGTDREYQDIIADLPDGRLHLYAVGGGIITRSSKIGGRWLDGAEASKIKASWPEHQQPSEIDKLTNGRFSRMSVSPLIRIK